MDVRDLAPALLGVGELFDAANLALNGDTTKISVNVKAVAPGCFAIDLEVVQSIVQQGIALLTGDEIAAALTLKELLFGGAFSALGIVQFLKILKGRKPEKIERISESMMRITIDGQTYDVPLKLLRLYQDLAVRTAFERVVEKPLDIYGIEQFKVIENGQEVVKVEKPEAGYFHTPEIEDQILIDDIRNAAFSIVSLAFKEENKWRLHDGQNQISATIADEDFLRRVDRNLIRFSKGDVLVCEVRVLQKQTAKGLTTEHIVERVIEHRPAARQLDLPIEQNDNNDNAS